MKKKKIIASPGRRKFLSSVTMLAGASVVLGVPGASFANGKEKPKAALTVKQVIDIILKEVPGAPFAKTVDQMIAGSLEQEVTGIVTTMFPTIEVIEKTAKKVANLIIAHENPFYNHQDQTDWLQQDEVYRHKTDLLKKHNIAIWRFHDYWHAHKPDGIIMGNLMKLGWDKYYDTNLPRLLTLPEPLPLKTIVAHVKKKLDIPTVRLIGNLNQPCSTFYLAFGYMDSQMQIAAIEQYKPDLILSGETREWETVERVRDGFLMGQKTALMVLSHAVSEEAGMAYTAKWLQPKVPDIEVTHIAAENPFKYI